MVRPLAAASCSALTPSVAASPYQVSPGWTVYVWGGAGVGGGVGAGVGVTAAGVGVAAGEAPGEPTGELEGCAAGAAVALPAGDGDGEEICGLTGRGLLASDVSPVPPGGRTSSHSATTLAINSANRDRRNAAFEGAALTGSRHAAQSA